MLCVSGSQLMKHPTLKHSHTPLGHTKWSNSTFLKLELTQTRYGGIYGVQMCNSHSAHLTEDKESQGLFCPLKPKQLMSVIGQVKSYSFGAL